MTSHHADKLLSDCMTLILERRKHGHPRADLRARIADAKSLIEADDELSPRQKRRRTDTLDGMLAKLEAEAGFPALA